MEHNIVHGVENISERKERIPFHSTFYKQKFRCWKETTYLRAGILRHLSKKNHFLRKFQMYDSVYLEALAMVLINSRSC